MTGNMASERLFSADGVADVDLFRPEAALVVHWHSFHDTQGVIEVMKQGLNVVKQHQIRVWVADTQRTRGAMSDEAQALIAESVSEFEAAGLEAVLTVTPTSAVTSMSNRRWQGQVRKDFVMQEVGSVEEALDLGRLKAAS
jgi:hypothetical protein